MKILKRVFGTQYPNILTSIANLASTYWNQGRRKEAEELQVQVLERSLRVLGEKHPSTLSSMNNLACTLKRCDRNEEAIKLMEKCVQFRTLVLGADHFDTVSSSVVLMNWQTEGLEIDASAARVPGKDAENVVTQ